MSVNPNENKDLLEALGDALIYFGITSPPPPPPPFTEMTIARIHEALLELEYRSSSSWSVSYFLAS